ncbi:hypothetical protein [Jiangella endophytica]|uniref:hypothetical protein n=1 Tax=Jiangella endophytica TaxID=1623398 RepID=UPI00130054FD|nr:hypothetical protein [Jiangella endophytica]
MMTDEYERAAEDAKQAKRGRHRGASQSLLQDLRAAIVARIPAEDRGYSGPRRARRHA